jgi:hypothetical protein
MNHPIVKNMTWDINVCTFAYELKCLLMWKKKYPNIKKYVHVSLIIEKRNKKRGGRTVIAYGFNGTDTDRKGSRHLMHSEECVLKKMYNKRKKKIELVNLSVTQGGSCRISKPCCKCAKIIRNPEFRIRNVSWTINNETFGFEKLKLIL